MPLVKILQAIGGTDFSWVPGEIVSMTDEQVAVWCDGERAELATEVVVDQAAIDEAVSRAVEGAGHVAEQLRLAELEQRQDEARSLLTDSLPAGFAVGLAEVLAELVVELVAGVAPGRAVELALAVQIGESVGPTLVVPAAAGDGATGEETEAVPEAAQPEADQTAASAEPVQQDERAQGRPERAARQSRGGGRGEPRQEKRG
jgi:hypothetical protein